MGSFERANKLFGEDYKASEFILIKLKLDSCWCFKHKPLFWEEFNEYLGSKGPIENEGDLLLTNNDERYVLECHETGPEIVLLTTASISLITAVITLISAIVSLLKKEHSHNHLKVIKRKVIKDEMVEEIIVELDVNDRLKESNQKDMLKQALKKALK